MFVLQWLLLIAWKGITHPYRWVVGKFTGQHPRQVRVGFAYYLVAPLAVYLFFAGLSALLGWLW